MNKESGTLRTIYLRKAYYENKLNYVKPEAVRLGEDHLQGIVYYHYVSIKETLIMLLQNEYMKLYDPPKQLPINVWSVSIHITPAYPK